MSSSYESGISLSDSLWLRNNKWELVNIPGPDTTWTADDVEVRPDLVRALAMRAIIVRSEPAYRIKARHYDRLQEYLSNPNALLPCGHDAFHNAPDIEGVRCKVESCQREFAKEEVNL